MNKHDWIISPEQYKTMISFMGWGNFPNAKIVFFGIEEGTGGFKIPENIIARVNDFGQFENGSIESSFTPGTRVDGYWEPDAKRGADKIRNVLGLPPTDLYTGGAFNPTIARISLELEQPHPDPNHWFQLYSDYPVAQEDIFRRIGQLYRKDSECKIDFALNDWHPLPRPNMSEWFPEYSPVNERLYLKAFDDFNRTQRYQDEFSDYSEDALKREGILKRMLTTFSIPLIIGLGKIPTKKKLLEKLFPGLRLDSFPSAAFPAHPGLHGKVQLDGQMLNVLLLPFPAPFAKPWTTHCGDQRSGAFALRYFQEVTCNYIKPLMKKYL